MTAQAEHAEAPSVVRIIELVGVSKKSWSDAAQQAVIRASETVRHVTGVDVLRGLPPSCATAKSSSTTWTSRWPSSWNRHQKIQA